MARKPPAAVYSTVTAVDTTKERPSDQPVSWFMMRAVARSWLEV